MATLTTKYDIGDTVWHASITTEKRQHDCPDCLGAKTWKALSPAGGEFEVSCPRCTEVYMSNRNLSLTYAWWVGTARAMTVGSIKANTQIGDSFDGGNTYMCVETGVGSGSVYREAELFATREAALLAAETKASVENANAEGWVAKQYSETAKFSDYQLKDAEMESAKSRASASLRAVGYLLEDLDEAESLAQVRDAIEAWRDKRDAA